MLEVKQQIIYRKEISEDTFKGKWPLTVSSGTLINNSSAIVFTCKKGKTYNINGNAQDRFRRFNKIRKIHKRSPDGFFVSLSDIIMEGLKMDPDFKLSKSYY
jgi:hypothetical protein